MRFLPKVMGSRLYGSSLVQLGITDMKRRAAVPTGYGAVLDVDLDAIAANYGLLRARAPDAQVAACVKADAYGLGAAAVVPTLVRSGCQTFFVATAEEGRGLRDDNSDVEICVLNGYERGEFDLFGPHRLTTVLNSLDQIAAWLNCE